MAMPCFIWGKKFCMEKIISQRILMKGLEKSVDNKILVYDWYWKTSKMYNCEIRKIENWEWPVKTKLLIDFKICNFVMYYFYPIKTTQRRLISVTPEKSKMCEGVCVTDSKNLREACQLPPISISMKCIDSE